MRIALACGLCLLALTAAAAPRAKDEAKSEAKDPVPASTMREGYRSRMNENVVTIMAGVGLTTFHHLAAMIAPPLAMAAIFFLEGNFFTPAVVGHRFTLNPLLVLVSLSFWLWLWGPTARTGGSWRRWRRRMRTHHCRNNSKRSATERLGLHWSHNHRCCALIQFDCAACCSRTRLARCLAVLRSFWAMNAFRGLFVSSAPIILSVRSATSG